MDVSLISPVDLPQEDIDAILSIHEILRVG